MEPGNDQHKVVWIFWMDSKTVIKQCDILELS